MVSIELSMSSLTSLNYFSFCIFFYYVTWYLSLNMDFHSNFQLQKLEKERMNYAFETFLEKYQFQGCHNIILLSVIDVTYNIVQVNVLIATYITKTILLKSVFLIEFIASICSCRITFAQRLFECWVACFFFSQLNFILI